jgi:2-polyprenyl-3-methyl-5-hydroxy-6-metoxy-1,4-benzoquinol methylase
LADRLLAEEALAFTGHDYLQYHRRRFEYVMRKCAEFSPDRSVSVLDVGRSSLSRMLLERYDNVTTIGLPLSAQEQFGHEAGTIDTASTKSYAGHIVFDLNYAQNVERLDLNQKFALIVFAETIEHLYTAPELVLGLLGNLLEPGGLIICQTPNAVALHKRILMALGFNPFERLRIDVRNRGHIREYTRKELIEIGRRASLDMISHEYRDYFGVAGGWARRVGILFLKAMATLHPPLARGQTIIYRRSVDSSQL